MLQRILQGFLNSCFPVLLVSTQELNNDKYFSVDIFVRHVLHTVNSKCNKLLFYPIQLPQRVIIYIWPCINEYIIAFSFQLGQTGTTGDFTERTTVKRNPCKCQSVFMNHPLLELPKDCTSQL